MAIAKYKILEPVVYNGETLEVDSEVNMPDRFGERFVKQRKAVLVRYLDPTNEGDSDDIDTALAVSEDIHGEVVAQQTARESAKDAELQAADIVPDEE